MKSMLIIAALVGVIGSAATFARATERADALTWQHFAAESSCKLIRSRPTGPGLVFVTRPASEAIQISLYLDGSRAKAGFGTGQLFVGDYRSDKFHFRTLKRASRNGLVLQSSVTTDEFSRIVRHGSLRVRAPRYGDLTVDLTGMPQAMNAVRACQNDLARKWGIYGDWTRPPTPFDSERAKFRADDYPTDLIRRGISGSAVVLLTVSEKGNVSACRPVEVTGNEVFGAITCSVLQSRSTFAPGTDGQGRPTTSYIVSPVISFDLFD